MNQHQHIWVLGAGQLGAMLKHAGMPLGIQVTPVDINEHSAPQLAPSDLVTAEREQWPSTLVTQTLAQHPGFMNQSVFTCLADRKTQKEFIDQLGIATAPWRNLNGELNANDLFNQLGERVLLKRRTGGYDGKGQHWLNESASEIPANWQDHAIAEQAIAFDEEVSLIGVRNRAGECAFYPLTLNLHLNGILYASVAPLDRLTALQNQAEVMLEKILTALNYVGVMAMECFRVGHQLMINELAPRVHNSGHWTQSGANISQFEYHLRAIANLPIPAPQILHHNLMINLIGTHFKPEWLTLKNARVYWYGKEVHPGRKVGHINLFGKGRNDIEQTLTQLSALLPEQYYSEAAAWSRHAMDDWQENT
jgi:5-(carboxyamino)imidazole ribonucleotide synthase